MRKLLLLLFGIVLMVGTSTWALAQGIDGTLRGEVKDPSGAIVPAAKVTITNEQTGLQRTMEASSVGTFNFPNLLVGTYTVTVEFAGFKKFVQAGVEVKANSVSEVSVALEVGPTETSVEVTAGADLVQTTTSQLSTSWDSRQLTQLPLPVLSGDPQNLAIFQTGTTTQSGGVVGVGGSIGGNRPRNNNFVVDGIDNNDISITGPVQPVIPDSVAEFTLITNQFSAEYGHSTAGQFIQTTKSGTNSLHGDAFWFLNNRRLNSLDNLDKASIERGDIAGKPRYDRNRFGGTLGGPVKKDKVFLFGAFQYTGLFLAATPGAVTDVPTAAGFQTLTTLASTPGSGVSSTMVDMLQSTVPPAAAATGSVDVINEATSPGEAVPIEVGTYAPTAPDYFRQYDWNLNLDVNTARHRFSGRFMFDRYRSPDVPSFPLPQFVGTYLFDARSVTFADAFSISSSTVNEFRAGYRRSYYSLDVPAGLTAPAGLDIYPNFTIDNLNMGLGPTGESPQYGAINTYQVTDTLSLVRGRHTYKLGADIRLWISPGVFLPRARGDYDWSTLDSFVKDAVPDGAIGALRGVGDGSFAGNQKAIYAFVQDDIKLHPRFTLNLGLRYEWTSNPRDDQKQELNSVADLPSPSNPGLAPLLFHTPKTDKNNWAPRLGFAWDLFGDHKTSLRGGFGMAYDVIFQNLPLLQLPPQLQQELNPEQVCGFAAPPAWCATGRGFIAGGALPATFVPQTLSQADARSGTQGLIVDTTSPVSYTWSLALQRTLGGDWLVEARYLGTRGLRLPVQVRLNATVLPPDDLFLPTYFNASDVPGNVALTAPSLADWRAARDLTYAADGFDGGYITAFPAAGNSTYHGGSLEVTRRISQGGRWGRGLFLRSGYTWSKTIDNSTNELFTSVVNPRRPEHHGNLTPERGLSALHHEHKFTLAFLYDLPKYGGTSSVLKGFLNQWQVSSTFIAETGQPITPLSFNDANGNFDSAGDRAIVNPGGGSALTVTDVSLVCRDPVTGATSIAASCTPPGEPSSAGYPLTVGYVADDSTAGFVRARPGTKTNSGRDILTTAGINNWNLAIFKDTYITENKYIQFRVDMLNAFNHPQFVLGSGTIDIATGNAQDLGYYLAYVGDNADFMKPANIFSSGRRYIQFALKYVF